MKIIQRYKEWKERKAIKRYAKEISHKRFMKLDYLLERFSDVYKKNVFEQVSVFFKKKFYKIRSYKERREIKKMASHSSFAKSPLDSRYKQLMKDQLKQIHEDIMKNKKKHDELKMKDVEYIMKAAQDNKKFDPTDLPSSKYVEKTNNINFKTKIKDDENSIQEFLHGKLEEK